jgi:hypothetical protein
LVLNAWYSREKSAI